MAKESRKEVMMRRCKRYHVSRDRQDKAGSDFCVVGGTRYAKEGRKFGYDEHSRFGRAGDRAKESGRAG